LPTGHVLIGSKCKYTIIIEDYFPTKFIEGFCHRREGFLRVKYWLKIGKDISIYSKKNCQDQ